MCVCVCVPTVECFENRQLYFANRLNEAMKVRLPVSPLFWVKHPFKLKKNMMIKIIMIIIITIIQHIYTYIVYIHTYPVSISSIYKSKNCIVLWNAYIDRSVTRNTWIFKLADAAFYLVCVYVCCVYAHSLKGQRKRWWPGSWCPVVKSTWWRSERSSRDTTSARCTRPSLCVPLCVCVCRWGVCVCVCGGGGVICYIYMYIIYWEIPII